jgi:hypothetical protein
MPPGSSIDDIIELYKRDVDITLIDESCAAPLSSGCRRCSTSANRSTNCASRPAKQMIHLSDLLRALGGAGVDFILIGGVAAAAHGSARLTQDVEIVYRRGPTISRESWPLSKPRNLTSGERRKVCPSASTSPHSPPG